MKDCQYLIYVTQSSNLFLLKFSFSEKATKVWKNLPLDLKLLSKNNCFVKTSGRLFQILRPPHNIWTLNDAFLYYSFKHSASEKPFAYFCMNLNFCTTLHCNLAHSLSVCKQILLYCPLLYGLMKPQDFI